MLTSLGYWVSCFKTNRLRSSQKTTSWSTSKPPRCSKLNESFAVLIAGLRLPMYIEIEFLNDHVKKLEGFIASVKEFKTSRSEKTATRRKCKRVQEEYANVDYLVQPIHFADDEFSRTEYSCQRSTQFITMSQKRPGWYMTKLIDLHLCTSPLERADIKTSQGNSCPPAWHVQRR